MEDCRDIRIIPMSKNEFLYKGFLDVQNNFFLGSLKKQQKNKYYFRKSGINASVGTVLLFQYGGQLIASAILKEIERYNQPIEDVYKGAYILETNSIKVFDPITAKEFSGVVDDFTGFSQSKKRIKQIYWQSISKLIDEKSKTHNNKTLLIKAAKAEINKLEREAVLDDVEYVMSVQNIKYEYLEHVSYKPRQVAKMTEQSRKAYKRDPIVASVALGLAKHKCELCGDKRLFLRKNGDHYYTEPHHLIPISLQGNYNNSQSLDNIANIVSLCSHCHNLLHYGRYVDKAPLLELLYSKRIDKLIAADIYISLDELKEIYD